MPQNNFIVLDEIIVLDERKKNNMKLHNILNSWDMNINLKITNFMGQVKTIQFRNRVQINMRFLKYKIIVHFRHRTKT